MSEYTEMTRRAFDMCKGRFKVCHCELMNSEPCVEWALKVHAEMERGAKAETADE